MTFFQISPLKKTSVCYSDVCACLRSGHVALKFEFEAGRRRSSELDPVKPFKYWAPTEGSS